MTRQLPLPTDPVARHLATTTYQVTVTAEHEDHARRLLLQHMRRTG